MAQEAILGPVIALVGLTGGVWIWMYATRLRFVARQRIDPQDLADRVGAGERLRQVSGPASNLVNLFETPILFYLLAIMWMRFAVFVLE